MDKKAIIILQEGHSVRGTAHYTKDGDFVFYSAPWRTLRRHYSYNELMGHFVALDGLQIIPDTQGMEAANERR